MVVCHDGDVFLTRPDGTTFPASTVDLFQRPAIFNGGATGVISHSSIYIFDENLQQTGKIPLPSGVGTGDRYKRPPLIDSDDNLAIFEGENLYIMDREGNVIAGRTFENEIREIRLGPEHLYVAFDAAIMRFIG